MMNDKLQLHEIVGYLPYGLKGKYTLSDVVKITEWQKDEIRDKKLTEDCVQFFRLYCKPILCPLSDLTKEIEVNGERFVPLKYLLTNVFMCDYPEFELTTDLEILINSPESQFNITLRDVNNMYQKLYQWHFDIHDLINRNLAIDINTLDNER